ncbi:MAG: beta strand repeat-containing protein, partial [Acidobacteriota bacterium]
MTRFVRPLACVGVFLLAVVMWTCSADHTTGNHGPATSLTFTAGPANVTAGVPIPTVKVTALDANGHPATDFAGAVTLSISTGTGTSGATLSGTTTVSASLGVASFTTLSIDKIGSGYSLQATASGLTSAASPTFSVACGSATQLAFTTQPTGTKAGVAIAPAVKVTAQDALGNTCSNFTGSVTVAITSGTGAAGATLSGTPSAAAVAGIATFADLQIDKVGAVNSGTGYTLSATAPSLTAATSDPFDIQSGTATHLQFTSQPTDTAAGAEFSPLVEVSALDAAGNVATTFSGNVTLAIGTNAGGATLGGTKVVATTNGVATFHGIFLDKVGSGYTLSASASGLTAATSAAFNVTAGPAANLAFTTQPVTTTDAAPIAPAVRINARDAFGNLADGFAGNVTIAIAQNPGGGTLSGTTTLAATQGAASFTDLTIDKVGAGYTLTASAAGVNAATSAAFDIVASTASMLVCTVQPTTTVAGNAIAAIQVTARDASNQTVTSFTGGVTIAIGTNPGGGSLTGTTTDSAASGVATFSGLSIDKSGSGYTLTATSAGLQSASCGPFDITGGTASQLAFTVQPTNVGAGTTIHPQVEVTAHDALGNVATGFTGSVTLAIANNPSGGTLSGTASVAAVAGVAAFNNLSINNAGPAYTLSASAAGPSSATSAAFDVTTGAPSQLVFTAQPPNAAAGATLIPAVQVTAKDSSGNVVT